jgi:NtrC-family two-component system response regulator AlgB
MPKKTSVLVVDDEATIRRTVAICLEADGFEVHEASSLVQAAELSQRHYFALAFVDLRLGTQSGMELLPTLLANSPGIRIIMITAFGSFENAVTAIKQGAFDYLPKPFTPEQVRLWAQRALHERRELERVHELGQRGSDVEMESQAPPMQQAIALARQVASTDATVLLRGETGTGKGVLARAIHDWSARAKGPFAVVSCPAIPAELLESELFGHIAGAFTGAHREQLGRIARAESGSLFMDEIGDLPLSLQPKLLRFLQDREYERLGESLTRKSDVRVIAATNADLRAAVEAGKFREDLYYRLNVIEIYLPPLRQRKVDILHLAGRMLGRFAAENRKEVQGFRPDAQEVLVNYSWPGNLRELCNVVERAVILSTEREIGVPDLPSILTQHLAEPRGANEETLEAIEERHIRRVLSANRSLEDAARILDIDVATLWRKRRKYGIKLR